MFIETTGRYRWEVIRVWRKWLARRGGPQGNHRLYPENSLSSPLHLLGFTVIHTRQYGKSIN